MNLIDLTQILLKICSQYDFPSNIINLFKIARSNKDIQAGIKNLTNQYQNFDNSLLYDLILFIYCSKNKFFYPVFKYDVDNTIFDSNQPRLCLGLHSNFSSLMPILLKKNLNFVLVSDFPEGISTLAFRSGVRFGNIKLIRRDETCLLNAKKFLQKNYLVSSTIDFKSQMPGPFNMLSDNMVRLAISIRPKLFFGINFVNNIGELTYFCRELKLDPSIDKMRQNVQRFIANSKNRANYKFGKYNHQQQQNLISGMLDANLSDPVAFRKIQ